ncbi:MAG: adenylosuccinate lyase [Gammaproteobacteria bacterium]
MKNYNLDISAPTDGRYASLCEEINAIFSEHNLIKMRVKVEVEWFIFISNQKSIKSLPALSSSNQKKLRDIYLSFNKKDSQKVKKIEETTKHDVKAVEYFLKDKIKSNKLLNKYREHIHICCTSEDINNISYAFMIQEGRNIIIKKIDELQKILKNMGKKYKNVSMLSHTHGQPASPTTMGKEFINYQKRVLNQLNDLKKIKIRGKFNGATGNYSSHHITYSNINWPITIKKFIKSLKLDFNSHTTQIEPHDYIADICYKQSHINSILIDFAQDIWSYISKNYFNQKNIAGEIGSSTMPHKINPINFENAEGNLGMSNALSQFFANKLTISRLQRDLSDSTVLRNIGLMFSYSMIAYKNILIGLNKLEINKSKINNDIDNSWEILAEPIQMVARKYQISNSYEYLKKFTRGKTVNKEIISKIINNLDIPLFEKKNLLALTPRKYIGFASKLCDQ